MNPQQSCENGSKKKAEKYTDELKAEAVKLFTEQGYIVITAFKFLDILRLFGIPINQSFL